ncbi:MAG: ribosome biogenesis GTPase YlqF [Desulfobacterales bacterium]|nr:ribosome biogenesis GTPase YlqF [Desulfobacterales bacterium]
MSIQWFPGHMKESMELLKNSISKANIVLEILDARLPFSSSNPYIENLCKNILKIKILNKNDIADPDITKKWLNYYKSIHEKAIAISAKDIKESKRLIEYCQKITKKNKAEKMKLMVIGIPNTGKSTIINSIVGKKVAKTGNVPAITRHNQRMATKDMDIYDTPGLLWPVLEPKLRADILAASGAIANTAIDYNDTGAFTLDFLIENYPNFLKARYKFDTLPNKKTHIIEKIGIIRGCLQKGGIIDIPRTYEILVNELRQGKLGRISFEKPAII